MKKKFIFALLTIVALFTITGCGKKNVLLGTWEGKSDANIKTTFIFEKEGKVKYDNEFGADSTGTYEIKEDIVTIELKSWTKKKEYKFEVKDNKLTLTAQDSLSPSYKNMTKK